MPHDVVCKLCGGRFFARSLPFHQKQCVKKYNTAWIVCEHCGREILHKDMGDHIRQCVNEKAAGGKPERQRRQAPESKPRSPLNEISAGQVFEGRVTCNICDRKFTAERIARHMMICNATRNRPTFDASAKRMAAVKEQLSAGEDNVPQKQPAARRKTSIGKPAPAVRVVAVVPPPSASPPAGDNWRDQRAEFLERVRAARDGPKQRRDVFADVSVVSAVTPPRGQSAASESAVDDDEEAAQSIQVQPPPQQQQQQQRRQPRSQAPTSPTADGMKPWHLSAEEKRRNAATRHQWALPEPVEPASPVDEEIMPSPPPMEQPPPRTMQQQHPIAAAATSVASRVDVQAPRLPPQQQQAEHSAATAVHQQRNQAQSTQQQVVAEPQRYEDHSDDRHNTSADQVRSSPQPWTPSADDIYDDADDWRRLPPAQQQHHHHQSYSDDDDEGYDADYAATLQADRLKSEKERAQQPHHYEGSFEEDDLEEVDEYADTKPQQPARYVREDTDEEEEQQSPVQSRPQQPSHQQQQPQQQHRLIQLMQQRRAEFQSAEGEFHDSAAPAGASATVTSAAKPALSQPPVKQPLGKPPLAKPPKPQPVQQQQRGDVHERDSYQPFYDDGYGDGDESDDADDAPYAARSAWEEPEEPEEPQHRSQYSAAPQQQQQQPYREQEPVASRWAQPGRSLPVRQQQPQQSFEMSMDSLDASDGRSSAHAEFAQKQRLDEQQQRPSRLPTPLIRPSTSAREDWQRLQEQRQEQAQKQQQQQQPARSSGLQAPPAHVRFTASTQLGDSARGAAQPLQQQQQPQQSRLLQQYDQEDADYQHSDEDSGDTGANTDDEPDGHLDESLHLHSDRSYELQDESFEHRPMLRQFSASEMRAQLQAKPATAAATSRLLQPSAGMSAPRTQAALSQPLQQAKPNPYTPVRQTARATNVEPPQYPLSSQPGWSMRTGESAQPPRVVPIQINSSSRGPPAPRVPLPQPVQPPVTQAQPTRKQWQMPTKPAPVQPPVTSKVLQQLEWREIGPDSDEDDGYYMHGDQEHDDHSLLDDSDAEGENLNDDMAALMPSPQPLHMRGGGGLVRPAVASTATRVQYPPLSSAYGESEHLSADARMGRSAIAATAAASSARQHITMPASVLEPGKQGVVMRPQTVSAAVPAPPMSPVDNMLATSMAALRDTPRVLNIPTRLNFQQHLQQQPLHHQPVISSARQAPTSTAAPSAAASRAGFATDRPSFMPSDPPNVKVTRHLPLQTVTESAPRSQQHTSAYLDYLAPYPGVKLSQPHSSASTAQQQQQQHHQHHAHQPLPVAPVAPVTTTTYTQQRAAQAAQAAMNYNVYRAYTHTGTPPAARRARMQQSDDV